MSVFLWDIDRILSIALVKGNNSYNIIKGRKHNVSLILFELSSPDTYLSAISCYYESWHDYYHAKKIICHKCMR